MGINNLSMSFLRSVVGTGSREHDLEGAWLTIPLTFSSDTGSNSAGTKDDGDSWRVNDKYGDGDLSSSDRKLAILVE
jgi:hypothetical protein